jgi:hypothetical protein
MQKHIPFEMMGQIYKQSHMVHNLSTLLIMENPSDAIYGIWWTIAEAHNNCCRSDIFMISQHVRHNQLSWLIVGVACAVAITWHMVIAFCTWNNIDKRTLSAVWTSRYTHSSSCAMDTDYGWHPHWKHHWNRYKSIHGVIRISW